MSCLQKSEQEENSKEMITGMNKTWTLVWSDEFDQKEIDPDNWNFQIEKAGRFNEEWQRYTNNSKNAYIDDGCLVIQANHISDEHGMDHYTSARLNTANKQTWKYGKISARIKLPEGKGIWPAFWMLGVNIDENGGDTTWPQCGEIDILELYGSKDDGAIEVNAHYADSTNKHAFMGAESYKLSKGKFSEDFHIFDLVWTEDSIEWYVDDNKVTSMNIKEPYLSEFHKPFFILLNIAVGGSFAGRPDDTTVFPQKMYVDWIRVYKQNEA